METEVDDIPPESFINDRRQDWLSELSAEDYSRFLSLFEELIGIPYQYSPEATAAALLRHLHDRPGGKRLSPATMPPPALEPSTEADIRWIRPLTADERTAPYIVAYDVNAAYLAACSALPLGVGEPRLLDGWALATSAMSEQPGYFLVGGGRVADINGPAGRWMTTPTLQWEFRDMTLPIWEGYIWDEASRPLEPWYKVLRDARAYLLGPLDELMYGRFPLVVNAVRQTIKMMYCGFFGRCASTKWDRTGDVLFRPDWRHMVIATRRTRLQRVMALADPAPFAAFSDCLYFATDHQVTGLKMGTNPGSFKIHGTVKNEGEVRTAAEEGRRLARLVELAKD